MIVLEYEYLDQYHITVQTQDIQKFWEKFRVRVSRPEEYCDYSVNPDGKLKVYNCDTVQLEEIESDNWKYSRPVFFETCEYSIDIEFNNILPDTKPNIIHENAEVERAFHLIDTKKSTILSGTINFLNQPGRFYLRLSYTTQDGINHDERIEFPIVSPKLDIKKDLNTIIKELKNEFDDLVFRYLTLTYQQFSSGNDVNNDLIWLSVFKKVIDGYLVSVRYILHSPHNQHITETEYLRADRVKKWTNPLAEQFSEDYADNQDIALRKFYRNEYIDSTENTLENRFVKYTIEKLYIRLGRILKQIRSREDISHNETTRLEENLRTLDSLRNNSFFRGIGLFEGFRQESMVLQQRTGYSQVYRYWIMLQRGLDLIDGDTSVGVQPIWKLYELWCFLKIKKMVAEVLGIDLRNADHLQNVHEETLNNANPFSGGDLSGSVIYDNVANGDEIEIAYQYSFNYRDNNNGFRSMTVEQKPDIVLHIHKKDNITLTYLFDAKYRVSGEDDPSNGTVKDYPVEDTLNQMHRYRDAIYYGDVNRPNFSKEVIGGYILFPGRLDEYKCQELLDKADYNNKALPYYVRSIEFVNIGAFPLLPSEDSGILLRHFLERIILHDDVRSQIVDSIPQRGMYYSVEDDGISVLIGCYKSEQHKKWILEHNLYNLRLDKNRRGAVNLRNDFTNAEYLLLYDITNYKNHQILHLTGETEVMDSSSLLELGYPEPGGHLYLVLSIDDYLDPRLKNRPFDLSDDILTSTDGSPMIIKYINFFPPDTDE